MNARELQTTLTPALSFTQMQGSLLQRKCDCGSHTMAGSECEGCGKNQQTLQRSPSLSPSRGEGEIPSSVHQVLRSPGQPLDYDTRRYMEPRFGRDFSNVRVHTDIKAAESARSVNALAYTVGRDVVFGMQHYAPGTAAGRKLLAHELTHTIQQGGNGVTAGSKLTLDNTAGAAEKEADIMAGHVVTGAPALRSLTSSGFAIQRETPGGEAEKKPAEEKETGEVITEGLKTVAEQAKDNNPKVKKVIIDPIKDQLKGQWNRLSTGEKIGTVGFGVGTLGMVGGALLSDPSGRKHLEDINLATPFTVVPYMPLSSFKYKLPSGDSPDERLFKFETNFKADDLINIRTESRGLPKMSLGVNMQWGYDPATERLSILGGDATLGIVPGLSISAGAYKDIIRPPQTIIGPQGQMTQIKKRVPEFNKPKPIPDVRVMLTVDLMKFKPGDLVRQIKGLF